VLDAAAAGDLGHAHDVGGGEDEGEEDGDHEQPGAPRQGDLGGEHEVADGRVVEHLDRLGVAHDDGVVGVEVHADELVLEEFDEVVDARQHDERDDAFEAVVGRDAQSVHLTRNRLHLHLPLYTYTQLNLEGTNVAMT